MPDNTLTNYTDALGKLGGTATGILGALKGGSKSSPAPAAPAKTNWALIGGIGAAFLLVVVLIMSLGGHK